LATQIEKLDNHTARLVVEVAQERVEKAMQQAAQRISRQVNIPGFRRGKAPYKIILQRVGAENVLNEAIDQLGNDVFREALDETKLEPYAPGTLENIETDPTLKLTFVVPLRPVVELNNYRDVRVPYTEPEVEDEAVNRTMKQLQDRRAVIEPASRPAQIGDQVKAHVNGERIHPPHELIHEEGEEDEAEAATEEGHDHDHEHTDQFIDQEVTVVLTEDDQEERIIPGFSQHIVGMNAGDKKQFTIEFPADYKDEGLAAHKFNFDVEVQEIQSRTLPILNDDFAKQVSNNESETLLDLRIEVRKDLQEAAKREAESKYSDEVLQQIVDQASVKYPEDMVEEYIDDILQNIDRNLRERGLSLDDYRKIEGKDEQALRAEYRDQAVQRLKRALVLGSVVDKENLDVSDSDVEAQIDKMTEQFGDQAAVFRQMMASDQNRANIAMDMITNRALERVMAIARGENPEITALAEPVQTELVAEANAQQPESSEGQTQQPEASEPTDSAAESATASGNE